MTLDEAVSKAFDGHEVKDFKHEGHEFHIKPIAVKRDGQKETADGQISHDIRFRPDDQVKYSIAKEGGVITKLDMSIDRGGLGRLVGKALKLKFGQGIPDVISDGVGKLIDGKWEGACRDIVQRIAARL